MTETPTLFQITRSLEDPDAIAAMAASPDPLARLGVASNPSATADVIRVLAHDAEASVKLQALLHPACPSSARTLHRDELPALVDAGAGAVTDVGGDAATWRRAVEEAIARW